MTIKKGKGIVLLLVLSALFSSLVFAQGASETTGGVTFPTREVRILVPFAAGGSSDLTARIVAKIINENDLLSKNVVVINMPGGGTRECLEEVLRSRPDGHTLLLHHNGVNTMNVLGQIPMNYKDFTPIAQVIDFPFVVMGGQSSDLQDYLDQAMANPGQVRAGVPAIGGVAHFAMAYALKELGMADKIRVIGFQGGAQAKLAQLSGNIEMRSAVSPEAIGYEGLDNENPLIVLSKERLSYLPNVPSVGDYGIENGFSLMTGVWGPPGILKM